MKENLSKTPAFDRLLKRVVSRKLLVWVVGTVMVFLGIKISDNWLILSGIYLGIQGIIDIWKESLKNGGTSFFNSSTPTDNNIEELEK